MIPSTAKLRDALRDTGLRATASRIAVLRLLGEAAKPLSHADVVDALVDETWDRATLYRNLIDLVEAGLARKVELGDRVWRFDLADGNQAHDAKLHPHFVCSLCGQVSCLPDLNLAAPKVGVPRALRELKVEVQIRGVCDDCGPA